MYFILEPKSRKEDLFNYREEYLKIKDALARHESIIAVLGVRRVGKTSMLNVIYNEISSPRVWIDGRIITSPKKEIPSAIYDVLKSGKDKIFGRIESLSFSLMGFGLGMTVGNNLSTIEDEIRKKERIFVFIDEAQRMPIQDLADVLSYFYDRLPNVSFIISGSEVGLLEQVIGENDADHPLFGRHITKILMKRLDSTNAKTYLKAGFEQLGQSIGEEEADEVVGVLDGLIGWLTLYGYEKGIVKNPDALEKTKKLATEMVASELAHFLEKVKNRKLYVSILRNANGLGWSELHTHVNKDLKHYVNPNSFTKALDKLLLHSFLVKKDGKYLRADPILLDATFLITT